MYKGFDKDLIISVQYIFWVVFILVYTEPDTTFNECNWFPAVPPS